MQLVNDGRCSAIACATSIQESLALVDGIRPLEALSCNARFLFSVDVAERRLSSIAFRPVAELDLHPLISAVTLETVEGNEHLVPLPHLSAVAAATKDVRLEEVLRRSYEPAVARVMRILYTFVDELPVLAQPDIPAGYFGPAYAFGPAPEAVYAATFLYHNAPGCAAFIADRGMQAGSPVSAGSLAHYQLGCGLWRIDTPFFGSLVNWFQIYQQTAPGNLPGRGGAWSRGVGELLREAVAFGYDKFVETYVDWLDGCLFAEASPPHWNRVPGNPEYCTKEVQVGNLVERGNRENDGHGICMWGRYMVYHWQGRSRAWNARRFAATAASVEWLQWQLDQDTLYPGVRKDVLFTQSECAHGGYDIYSSYNCLHGLKLAIRMAGQLQRTELVERWTMLYRRLRQGILEHLVEHSEMGPIWHTEANCDWQDHAHKLVHLHLATEGDTYTPLQDYQQVDDLERTYLEISRNSYRYLMREKHYDCLRMYGYGQGMMTQAALLLDEMEDATHFIDMLVRHAYLPHLSGWACPEGVIRHRSGKYYLPVNGYMGQDSHIADSTKALRLMLGIDDNRPEHVRLIPRFPAHWATLSVERFPVLTETGRQHLDYTYERQAHRHRFQVRFEQHPGSTVSIRLGPFSAAQQVTAVSVNSQPVEAARLHSGDSDWCWIDASGELEITIAMDVSAL